ncbi:hypothetical protein Q7P37_007607 [Cladosporium fusiforme]
MVLLSISFVLTACVFLVACDSAGMLGFALGNKRADGSCKNTNDYERDFDAIRRNSGSGIVRLYSVAECDSASQALPVARRKEFKIVLGVWPDTTDSFGKDKRAIASIVAEYRDEVYGVTVGSETLHRGVFGVDALLEKVLEIKNVLPHDFRRIGTAETWNKIVDGTADALVGHADVTLILTNAFAYWQPSPQPSETFFDQMRRVNTYIGRKRSGNTFGQVEIWTGETGWPSDGGSDNGLSKAGTAQAALHYQRTVCGAVANGKNVFVFEAFDEYSPPP